MAWYDNPNNPISGLLAPVATHLQETQKTDQAQRMLMGKYLLDQRASEGTRRFETLNANIKGYEDRRKDLETHKWNLLSSLIDPSSNQPLVGSARTQALTALGFKEDSFKIMMDAMDQDLKSLDRVLNQSYQLRNEMYGFGRAQGIQNTYAGGGYGAGQQGGDPVAAFLSQQGGQPTEATAATVGTSLTGQEQDHTGWIPQAVDFGGDIVRSIDELARGYARFATNPDNFINKAFEKGLINPNSDSNYALEVYRKALKLLPEGASEQQIQDFWLAPGLHERLKEIIEAGANDKKSIDLWLSEKLSPYDDYFKKVGIFLDWSGATDAAKKAVDVGGQLLDDARRYWFPSDAEVAPPSPASPSATTPPPAVTPPAESSVPYPAIDITQATIPPGNLSGVPSPDNFGTGLVPQAPSGVTGETPSGFPGQSILPPVQDRMSQWQQFVTDIGLPWDPSAVPTGVEDSFSDLGIRAYQRNLQNSFYEGSQMGASPPQSPMASGEWYIDSEISVVPTYEVFQQRIQGTPGDPGFYGAPVATGTSTDMAPAATQQQMSVAQGTPGDPNLQGNVGLDTSVTSPLFQDPMGGGVGQPTMNQQTVPMAPMGGTEGVMDVFEEGAMNPYITPGQPQGRVGPQRDPYAPPSLDGRVPPASYPSMGFGVADIDTWYQPPTGIGAPSGDPFDEEDALAAGDVGGPGQMILTPEEKTASSKREFEELASRFGSFTGETWNDFIDWCIAAAKENPLTIVAIAGAGGASYFLGGAIRRKAFNDYDKAVDAYNEKRAKGTPARTKIDQVADDVKEKDNMKKTKEKDGRSLSTKEQGKLDDLNDDLRNKKSLAWKDFMKKQAKRASWIGLGGAVIYGLSTEAFGMDNVDRQIGLVLDDNKKAQFALDAILKVNPITPILEMHQQPQGITTIRKERHSGPETHKAPGMLGAPGGMILNYPESAFPRSGLNSGAPQVQAMLSELEKKNQ